MKKLHHLIAALLVVVMLMGMLPASATEIPDAPDENLNDTLIERPKSNAQTMALTEDASGSCGENLTWELTTDGTLTISGEGAMEDYDFCETPWEDYRGQILSVVVEDGVTSIGDYSFWECWMLASVTLPGQMAKIGVSAFHGCEKLESIDLPDGITELGCSIFAFCFSLDHIEIPDGVTVIGESAFEGCENLEEIVIPTSVQTIETRAFADCASLAELVIPQGVPAIEQETACNCTSLKTVTIPASVMSIGTYAFEGCEALETVYFTGGRTQWDAMEIGKWNECLTEAEIICTGGDVMEGECGDALTWKLSGGVLTISGTGEMAEYTAKAAPWYAYRALIVSVTVENGVTGITSYAFQDCEALETVTLPESVEKIGSYAFDGCVSLEKAEIPKKVTVLSTGLFRNCTGLVCVTLPSGIETISSEAFYQCKSLTGVEIPAGVPEIGAQAFYWCSSIESITIPEGVTTVGSEAFNHCNNLKTLNVPESLTNIGKYAFAGLRSLETIYYGGCPKDWAKIWTSFPNGVEVVCAKEDVPETVVSGNCGDALVWELYDNGTLIISGTGAMENYAGWRDAPWCNSVVDIVRVVIEDGVTTVGSYAFSYSPELEEVELPDSLISIGKEAFSDCTSLTAIELPDGLVKIGSHAFDFCSVLTSITIPDSVTSLGEHAFDSCISMRELKISAGLTTIADYAFYNCSALVSVAVPEQVTRIGLAAFASCGELETIELPDGLTKIGNNAFSTCRKLQSIAIPAGVTEIGTYAFSGCEALESFVIPEGVTVISGAMFHNCTSLRSVTLHDNVTEVGYQAFAGCSGLTELDLPDTLLVIDGRAFSGCSTLKNLDIPAGVVEIGEGAFYGCTGLTSLIIPDGIPAIGERTFEKCSGLMSITIPRSVVSIGSFAFTGCTVLETVQYSGTEKDWGNIEIGEDNDALLSVEIIFNVVGVPELTVSNIASSGKIKLTWNKVYGAAKYEVWRATSKNGKYTKLTTTTKTSITNTKTEAGKTYYYKVRAVAEDVQGEFSQIVGRTCDCARPVVKATNIASTGKIKISWNKVDGAVKYEVYRAASKNGKYTRLTTTTKNSITNTKTQAGVTYYYKVKAIAEKSAANSSASAAVGRTCDLARPTVTVKLGSKGKPVVSWNAVSGAVKYEVWRSTSENGEYTRITTTTKTSITNTKAEAGVTYYYKVRAIASTSAANSAFSAIVHIKAK